MLVKLVNIADRNIFNEYSKEYGIYRELYDPSGLALETFSISNEDINSLKEIFIKRKLMFYTRNDSEEIRLLILGTFYELNELSSELSSNSLEKLGNLFGKILINYKEYDKRKIQLGERIYSGEDILVQGILNVTPDSFSDGGKYLDPDFAVEHAKKMIHAGVDIIDIGGESTRPGSEKIPVEEELNRVIPVIKKLREFDKSIPISIDTYKAAVAKEALEAGANIINDISAGTFDPEMLSVASGFNVPMILMHIKGTPKDMQKNVHYSNMIYEVYNFLSERIDACLKTGVNNLIIDPGIGFGKRLSDNYEIINRLEEFKGLGYPILIGLSRKSFLGNALDIPVEQRDIPTIISETISVLKGAKIIRTHNVENALYLKRLFKFYKNPGMLDN